MASPATAPWLRRSATGVFCLASLVLLAVGAAHASDYWYYYFKERVPLIARPDSFAIHDAAGSATKADLEDLVSEAGLGGLVSTQVTRGWWLFSLPSASGEVLPGGANPGPSSGLAAEELVQKVLEADTDKTLFVSPVFSAGTGIAIPAPQVEVQFEPSVSEKEQQSVLSAAGAEHLAKAPFGGLPQAFQLTGPRSGLEVLEISNRLAEAPEVIFSQPNMLATGRAAHIPNDPGFGEAWGLHNTGQGGGTLDVDIDAPEAWDITVGNADVITVVIDVGVQQNHPDIHQIPGADFTDDGPGGGGGPVNECDNHGTLVAGAISGIIDNGVGGGGAAPGTRIASARAHRATPPCAFGAFWFAESAWTVAALNWAETIGARITSNSNSWEVEWPDIAQKYAQTRTNGMLHFAIAGNDGISDIAFPGNLPSVNGVTALDRTGSLWFGSNYGPEVDFTGPGVDIYTTDRTGFAGVGAGSYTYQTGTSMAAPMIAGVAALLLSHAPALSPAAVEEILRQSALDLGSPGWDQFFGHGLAKARAALDLLIFADGLESGDTSAWSLTESQP